MTDLQDELNTALATGADTAPIRTKIAKAAEVQREQEAKQAEAAADLLASQQQRTEALAARLVAEALAEIESADDDTLAAFDGGARIADTSALQVSADNLAQVTITLEVAEDQLTPLRQHLKRLQDRLSEKQTAIAEIHSRRAGGDERSDDSGAMTLLQADATTLQELIDAAGAELAANDLVALRGRLDWCTADFARSKRDVLVKLSTQRLDRATALWQRVYNLQRDAERAAGLATGHPSGTWRAPLLFKTTVAGH